MSDNSKIEWTEATWNPVTGCTQISPGCAHCYAMHFANRFKGVPGHPYERGFEVQLREERLRQPIGWKRPRRIFVNSMSDLFHDEVPESYIRQVFAVMVEARQHTFQVLTKRAERARMLARCSLGRTTYGSACRLRTRTGLAESRPCVRCPPRCVSSRVSPCSGPSTTSTSPISTG